METRILKVSESEFILISPKRTKYASSIESLVVNCAFVGIKLDEIEAALVEMVRNDHNFANFGEVKKAFLYSGKL